MRPRRALHGPIDTQRFIRPNGLPKLRFLLLAGGLSLFGPLCIDMYLPALPRISTDLHASASQVQLSLTACLVGLGLGQLVIGPLSDRLGRRRPLVFGLALFVVASASCALAPNAAILALLRCAQGFGGAAGIVVARATVRDLFEGQGAARVFSMLVLVVGAGPVLAPQLGALLLDLTSWRGVFVLLSAAGAALLVFAALRLPETLSPERRSPAGLAAVLKSMRRVGSSRTFLQNAIACALGFGAIFAYVSGSSFVIEDIFGVSPQLFGLLFALNACGLVTASQVNGRLVGRFGSSWLMTRGLIGLASGSLALLLVVLSGRGGLIPILACMFCCLSSNGFIAPNAQALALQDFPDAAGTASALIGLCQFGLGAAVAPIVGLGGDHDALPMAIAMACFGIGALVVRLSFRNGNAAALRRPSSRLVEASEAIEPGF